MVQSPVLFPHEYRPVAGGALAVVVSAWVAAVGAVMFAFGAGNLRRVIESTAPDSGFAASAALISGLLLFLVACLATGGSFVFWRGRVRWNALLAVGPGWSKRPTGWPLNDVWTASDPALRYVAPVDRPRNATFVVWRLSSSLLIFSVAASSRSRGSASPRSSSSDRPSSRY